MANEEMIQKHLDNFLAKIAGETPVDDTIQNSTEFWINKIAGSGIKYTTTAPTAANTDGLKIVVLNAEPETKYDGYLYLITEA